MTEFYRNCCEYKLNKAQALRQAMLKTMQQRPDPREWEAFTLIGEAE
jgi:CHAT domain-containing protein